MPIEPALAERIKERCAALLAQGTLRPRSDLDRCYATFWGRFGPDVLKGLDGEALLDAVVANGRVIGLLDAKYRDLWARSLPREMLYQLAIYALSQPAGGAATILYPTLGSGATEARIEIREPKGDWGRAFVVIRPVDLLQLDALLSDQGTGPAVMVTRAAYASTLAFGSLEGIQTAIRKRGGDALV